MYNDNRSELFALAGVFNANGVDPERGAKRYSPLLRSAARSLLGTVIPARCVV